MEQLEETWRLETKQLLDTVNNLQEENRRLRSEVRDSTPSPSTNRLSPPRFTSAIAGDAGAGPSGMAASTSSFSSSVCSTASTFPKFSLRDISGPGTGARAGAGASRFESSSGSATVGDASANASASVPGAGNGTLHVGGGGAGVTACACPCSDCLQCSLGDELAIVRKLKQIVSQQRAEIRVLRRESIERSIELEVVRQYLICCTRTHSPLEQFSNEFPFAFHHFILFCERLHTHTACYS